MQSVTKTLYQSVANPQVCITHCCLNTLTITLFTPYLDSNQLKPSWIS